MPSSRTRPHPSAAIRAGLLARNAGVVAEALIAVTAASAAIRWVPFRHVMKAAAWRGASRPPRDPEAEARRVRWAVDRWADLLPWRAVCFQRGLAAQWMLRRRGIASFLHYGIDGRTDGRLSAHVWIEVDGRALMGGEDELRHAQVLVVPAPTQRG